MRKTIIGMVALLLGAMFLSACANGNSSNNNKLQVYTTIYPLQYFAERIGGEQVEVESILPPGTDAHNFEPTTETMINISTGDLFIYNGVNYGGYEKQIVETVKQEEVKAIAASTNIDLEQSSNEDEAEHGDHASHSEHNEHSEEESHHHGDVDEHVWLNPIFAIEQAEMIKDSLIEIKPAAKESFEENFKKLKEDLTKLDKELKTTIQNAKRKEILVSHAAYGYWSKRYGLNQISISGLSPSNEPSQRELKTIINKVNELNLEYIIFEQNVSTRSAEMLKKQLDLEVLYLHNLAVLTDQDIAQNENYITLMEKNIETLNKALND